MPWINFTVVVSKTSIIDLVGQPVLMEKKNLLHIFYEKNMFYETLPTKFDFVWLIFYE